MYKKDETESAILDVLYDNSTFSNGWTPFLKQLARHFDSTSATLLITDRMNPAVYQNFSAGIAQKIDYEAFFLDPFRTSMKNNELDKVHTNTDFITNLVFKNCNRYQLCIRPNNSFYAMGTQFERDESSTMHIGILRPNHFGMFTQQEQKRLEDLSSHLRRAIQLTKLTNQAKIALAHAHNAFNALPFGVWMLDSELRCKWLNRAAENTLINNCFGLRQRNGYLTIDENMAGAALTQALRKLKKSVSRCESVRLSAAGASLVLFCSREEAITLYSKIDHNENIIVFLLDPQMAITLDHTRLKSLYSLTAAEVRLIDLLVRGLDVTEASVCLHVTAHTTRSQLKSIMRKTEVNRQADLMRKLLLSVGLVNYH